MSSIIESECGPGIVRRGQLYQRPGGQARNGTDGQTDGRTNTRPPARPPEFDHTCISSSNPSNASASASPPLRLLFAYLPAGESLSTSSSVVGYGLPGSASLSASGSLSASMPAGGATIDSPWYVNPRKFSCTLLVNGLPTGSRAFFLRAGISMPFAFVAGAGAGAGAFVGAAFDAATIAAWSTRGGRSEPRGPFGVCIDWLRLCESATQSSDGSSSSRSMISSGPASRTSALVKKARAQGEMRVVSGIEECKRRNDVVRAMFRPLPGMDEEQASEAIREQYKDILENPFEVGKSEI